MQLYTEKDLSVLEKTIDEILDKIEDKKLETVEPTRKERLEINDIILNFLKDNKRKIYGGYAQNKLIQVKNPNDAFYKKNDIPDIDFYSPDPLNDLTKLADILYAKDFKHVQAKEALHKETYSIFVNFTNVCDISYVPKNIYHRMPFIEIDNINYVHPSFIFIDLYKIFTDPLFSSFRWKKTFPRLYLLQKHYPFNKATAPLPDISYPIPSQEEDNHKLLINTVANFLKNRETIIVIGNYVYNCLLQESKIKEDKTLGKKYRYLATQYFEFVSTDYRKDAQTLLENLKKNHPTLFPEINIVEYYPFWSYIGHRAIIFYKNNPIADIMHYNRRCIPIKKLSYKIFKNNSVQDIVSDSIQIGSFDYTLLNNFIFTFKARVEKNNERYQFHNIMTSHLIEMRNYFFDKTGLNLLEDTLFQELIPDCIGDAMDPLRESMLIREKKFKEGKKVIYKYDPSVGGRTPDYKFPNSSGNPIKNPRNFRIIQIDKELQDRRTREATTEEKEEIEEEVPEDILGANLSTESP